MPFTVSCSACDSRFLLGDDLFRRKVSGNIVTVRCRRCDAEIALDARDIDTLPSQDSPQRRVPHPPRPKGKTEPLAPAAPPAAPTQPEPVSEQEANATWDADRTVSIAGKASTPEMELLDFEEIPASSSDAPSLDALTHHAHAVPPPRRHKPADDFLVNLSAGTGGMLGASSVDAASWAERTPAPSAEAEMDLEPSTERTGNSAVSKGTVPLFDMGAVLPAASQTHQPAGAGSAPTPVQIDFGPAPKRATPPSPARERKLVIPPQDAPEPQKKRGGVRLAVGGAVLAAGLAVVVGLRGHRVPEPASSEPMLLTASAAPVVNAPAASESAAAEAASAAGVASAAAEASTASEASTAPVAPSPPASATSGTVKAALLANTAPAATAREPVVAEADTPAVSATSKPAEAAEASVPKAPVEIHNAPPPAAPGTEFDRAAALAALNGAAAEASSCRKEGDPSGTAVLTIIFAPSGRVTSAAIQGPPFAGTATGGCIASTMRHASIPAFDGDRVTVTKTVVIE